jgi:hypothetical protein
MSQDYVMIRKQRNADNYLLLLYFSRHNGTISVPLSNDDFTRLIKAGNAVLDQHKPDAKIIMPDRWATSEYKEVLDKVLADSYKENYAAFKPAADLAIFISDKRVDASVIDSLSDNAVAFMNAMGFEAATEGDTLQGPSYKRHKFVHADAMSTDELGKLYQKGKEALVHKHTTVAEQNGGLKEVADTFMESLENIKDCIVRLGGLIVLKKNVEGEHKVIVKQLPAEIEALLEKQPNLLFSLRTMYELLTGDVKGVPVLSERPVS